MQAEQPSAPYLSPNTSAHHAGPDKWLAQCSDFAHSGSREGSLPAQKAGGKMFATSARSHLNGAPELPAPRGAGHAQNAHEAATLARFKKEVTPALLGITSQSDKEPRTEDQGR